MPDSPLEVLLRSARQHRLPHGLLLNGPHIEDLEEAATELAATLLQGNQPGSSASPFSHPDFYVVRPANKSRQISADTVRDLIRNIHQTSFSNSGKVAVIVEADRMNQSSANIFLKTLEEPPSGTYLLLLTTRPYALLPTIRSRCLFFRFPSTGSRPLPSILQDWLKDFRAFLQQADQPVRGAGDVAPAIMSAYGLNVRFGRLLKEMIQAAKTAENLPQTDDADEIAAYEKRLEVEVRQEIFRQMVEETYRFAEDLGYTEKNFPINPCISTIREIEQASQLLQSNLNVQVALEHVLLQTLRGWALRRL